MNPSIRKRLTRILQGKLNRLADRPTRGKSRQHADDEWLYDDSFASDDSQVCGQSNASAARFPPTSEEAACLAILELPVTAAAADVRAAYKRLCKRYHPDRFTGDPEKLRAANELQARINDAYRALIAKPR